jgi:hypothetical protein
LGPLQPAGGVVAPRGGMRRGAARGGGGTAAAGLRLLAHQHAGAAHPTRGPRGALPPAHCTQAANSLLAALRPC